MNDEEILAAVLVAASGILLILAIITLCLLIYCVKRDKKPRADHIPALESEYHGNHNRPHGDVTPANKDEWPGTYKMHVVSHSYAFPVKGQRAEHGEEGSARISEMENVYVNRALENEADEVAVETVTTTSTTKAAAVITEEVTSVELVETAAETPTEIETAAEAATEIETTTTEVKTFSQEVFEEVESHDVDVHLRDVGSTRGSRPVSVASSTAIWKYNPAQAETTSQHSVDQRSIATGSTVSHHYYYTKQPEKEPSYYSSFQSRHLSVASSTASSNDAMLHVTRKPRSERRKIQEFDAECTKVEKKEFTFKLG